VQKPVLERLVFLHLGWKLIPMKPFVELTLAGRARRLRQMALNVLEQYDLNVTRVRLMTNAYNAIFRVETADHARYVVRIMRPGERSDQEIQSQARWVAELGRQGVNVATPIPNRDGQLVTLVAAPGVPEARQGMVCSWVPGASLGHCLSLGGVERQGALMARMHACAAGYVLPAGFQAKVYDCLYPYPEPWVLDDPAALAVLDDPVRERVGEMIPHVEAALRDLAESGTARQLLHGDLHQWNVMVAGDEVYAIDFDDLLLGWPVQDIGITLFYYRLRADFDEVVAAFRRGYEAVRPWPERAPGEVETWSTARALALLNGVLESDDPEDRRFLDYCVRHLMV
jgi:Ser/Thr protein kinase RdoA (MazF antagonist)